MKYASKKFSSNKKFDNKKFKSKDKFNGYKKKFNGDKKSDKEYNEAKNTDRYWKQPVPDEMDGIIKPKDKLNSQQGSDFIGLKPSSKSPEFLFNNNKNKKHSKKNKKNPFKYEEDFNSHSENIRKKSIHERNIERINLNKKIDFDDVSEEKINNVVNKNWQGSTYDDRKRHFNDKSTHQPTSTRFTKTNSNQTVGIFDKTDLIVKTKPEFIRTPEGNVKFYENKWYSEFRRDPEEEETKLSDDEILALKSEAEKILNDEITNFHSRSKDRNNQEARWMKTVVSKGTSSDKVAAQVIMIQDDPVYHLSMLSSLVNSVKVSKKNECLLNIDNLTELFLNDLLHPARKLKLFENQPLSLLNELTQGNALTRRRRLCVWLFEHELKAIYLRYVMALGTIMNDTVQANREKAISAVSRLLIGNMENEELLLINLVNKIGDPIQKVSAKVVYSLGKFVAAHPGTKNVVLNQVEKLLFRSNIGKRAQYYGTCFLSQFKILRNEVNVADSLMNIYFSFFKACVKTGDIDSRLMKALLTGVSRAYPYATKDKEGGNVVSGQHIETIFKIVHLASFTVSVHALSLLFRVACSDRFYCALYKQILDPKFPTSSVQNLFLNIIFHSITKDQNEARVRTFLKRLLEVCMTCPVPLACGILFIVSQILQKRSSLLFSYQEKIKSGTEGNSSVMNLDDDDEERYIDVNEEDDKDTIPVVQSSTKGLNSIVTVDDDDDGDVKPIIGGSWHHCSNLKSIIRSTHFEPLHRNPAYANGTKAVFTELETLSTHFHPTVALFASNILSKNWISYSGDPLQDFTLSRFLDRFSYRNPKKHPTHILASGVGEKRRFYNPSGLKGLAVNSDEYLNNTEQSIPVDELFLYKYLRGKREKKLETEEEIKKEKGENDDSDSDADNSSVCSEEFEEMLDNMMGKSTEDLDFADDVNSSKTSRKSKKKKDDNDDSESDDSNGEDDEEDHSDGENEEDVSMDENGSVDIENDADDDLMLSDDDNEEVMDFGDDDDVSGGDYTDESEDDMDSDDDKPKKKSKKLGSVKVRGRGLENMFAPAEHFSEMLEENAESNKSGTLSQLSNRDNSGEKQMSWEQKRNWKLNSSDRRRGGGGRGNFRGGNRERGEFGRSRGRGDFGRGRGRGDFGRGRGRSDFGRGRGRGGSRGGHRGGSGGNRDGKPNFGGSRGREQRGGQGRGNRR